jgi:D-glycero-D-manno-heptose 1,7-bisphosphate phosphatase
MEKGIFLDRDGVINEVLSHRVKFVNKPQEFHLLNGVGEAIRQLNEKELPVFVVTNQGGVGLGYMKETALNTIHRKMEQDLARFGAKVDDIAYCPHKPKAGCRCRKPEAQMLIDLAEKHDISLPDSIMVGDREPDIAAGKKAGCKTVFIGNPEENPGADAVFPDLLSAVPWLIGQ